MMENLVQLSRSIAKIKYNLFLNLVFKPILLDFVSYE